MKSNIRFYRNKKIIIIGAASGIGRAIVHQLVDYGAILFVTARSLDKLRVVFGVSTPLSFYELDVQDEQAVKNLFADLHREANGIDLVINLAGYDVFNRFTSVSEDEVSRCLDINVKGLITLTSAALDNLFKTRAGTLVTVCGFVNGRLAMPFFSIDAASRAAAVTLFRSLRWEYSGTDIRFVLFSPPGVNTESEQKERGGIWETNRVRLMDPEVLAGRFLGRLARGHDNIIISGFGERVLAFLDIYFPALAGLVFFRSFTKKTVRMLR